MGAVLGDVADLTTAVAGLAALAVEWATIWSGAITRDVSKFAASIALHGLSLAIASVVVRATALVAGSCAWHATAITTSEPTSSPTEAACRWCAASRGAVACKMTWLTARVAAATRSTAQAQSRAISLNVAKTLAVVALLRLGCAWVRAAVALMARLLAVVAKALGGRADLSVVADVATLVAGATR